MSHLGSPPNKRCDILIEGNVFAKVVEILKPFTALCYPNIFLKFDQYL